ncbi:PLP-dependent aminotransferase family protein [Microbulbifer variabilis]|uniref:PLP-dependent aminotransferase family protein n=1 Tax=Microbulbifer variabilis TaxID=266805 RepID=A0ABY4VBF2_9GAMM|nr:PLP-dependent aminotransferase family protein [Microbulbifer variabilis]USD20736.1 PLP-dependent aminotransferase family protein [Microbulbifer variabilis]
MSAPDLFDLSLDRNRPLQKQLYQILIDWIVNGRLTKGTKLPSSRRLSESLNISRNTVIQVIEQLKKEGFLVSKAGKAIYVSSNLAFCTIETAENSTLSENNPEFSLPPLSDYSETIKSHPKLKSRWPTLLPFSPGVPDLKLFPFAIWNKIYRQHQDRIPISGYGDPQGYLALRERLAQHLLASRGVRCTAEQIIITNGRQEALNICAQTILNSGDTVLMENPGYGGARFAFHAKNATVNLVELNENRLDIDQVVRENKQARLIYTTATYQHPMGGVIPLQERSKLLNWAEKSKCWILEDEANGIFSFEEKPIAALQGMKKHTPVIFIGSFSRTLLPSFRLGYLIVPKSVVPSFVDIKSILSGPCNQLQQAVLADFINDGHYVRHIRRMQINYQEKWEHFCQLIHIHLEPDVKLIKSSAAMFVVIKTPGHDDTYLHEKLNQRGFGSAPLSLSDANKSKVSGLILGCANTTHLQRQQFVEYLSKLLKKQG